jgi:hypothetical protein
MRRSLIALVPVLIAACGLFLPATASADPVPGIAQYWPDCGSAPDDDGLYCIVSKEKNGAPITDECGIPWEDPFVDLIGSGTVRFGVQLNNCDGNWTGDVSPLDTYELVVNTGSIRTRELNGVIRNVTFSRGGSLADGYTFTLSFQPTPISWLYTPDPGACTVNACGDDTTQADLEYNGFVTGYVTDLAGTGLGPDERDWRTGYWYAYNAQDAAMPYYDPDTNSLVLRFANPHLKADGVTVASGQFQTFIPNALLTNLMDVPSPSSLTGGSFTVTRSSGSTTAAMPFTLTHQPGGVMIDIASITYSRPVVRIRPKRTVPGAPRMRSAYRIADRTAKVSFRAPLANGGSPVTQYSARCRKVGGSAVYRAYKSSSPIVIQNVSTGRLECRTRAKNALGWGPLSGARYINAA